MKLTCLIIDDEPSSQEVLKTFVGRIDWIEVSSVCNNAIEALNYLSKQPVDLIFLDINMPELSGISFYKSLQNPPKVIFTTAYSEHALEGFELNAVDYLLKPFSFERFVKAIAKVKSNEEKSQEFIHIKSDKRIHQIKSSEISHIESIGDYVKVHVNDAAIVTYSTLKNMLLELPQRNFIQVHKSFIVNVDQIAFIEGNQIVIGANKIPLGQKFKKSFSQHFNS